MGFDDVAGSQGLRDLAVFYQEAQEVAALFVLYLSSVERKKYKFGLINNTLETLNWVLFQQPFGIECKFYDFHG